MHIEPSKKRFSLHTVVGTVYIFLLCNACLLDTNSGLVTVLYTELHEIDMYQSSRASFHYQLLSIFQLYGSFWTLTKWLCCAMLQYIGPE